MPISNSSALEIVRGAFSPLGCVASSNAFGDAIVFGVVDSVGNQVVAPITVNSDEYGTHESLERLIVRIRSDLSERFGHNFDPWQMPADPADGR